MIELLGSLRTCVACGLGSACGRMILVGAPVSSASGCCEAVGRSHFTVLVDVHLLARDESVIDRKSLTVQ